MNARPAKVCDWADQAALDLLPHIQLVPGNTMADICNTLAVALRSERAKGYAEAMTWADRTLTPRTWLSPREERERNAQRLAVRDSLFVDTQADHLQAIDEREPWVDA